MEPEKTLCKNCTECRTYTYKRTTKRDNLVTFKYCNGNYELIKQHDYVISESEYGINVIISDQKIGAYRITRYMKKNPENVVTFLNKERTDLRLCNLQERAVSCVTQENEGETSIFPGVTRHNNDKYKSMIKINGKMVFLGLYKKELDAYHHYLLKCMEIGRKINKTTRAYKIYKEQFDETLFKKYVKKKKNKHKNISYEKGKKEYKLAIIRNGKFIINKYFKNINDAVEEKKRVLQEYNEK